jgi:hypothetical protein
VNLDSGAGSPKAIREWAAQHGKAVSERGRISKELRDEYESAVAV